MHCKFNTACLSIVALLPSGAVFGQDKPASALQPVQAMIKSIKRLENVQIRATTRATATSVKAADGGTLGRPVVAAWGNYDYLFRREPHRTFISHIHHSGTGESPKRNKTEEILRDGELLYVSDRVDGNLVQLPDNSRLVVTITAPRIAGPGASKSIRDVIEGHNDNTLLFGYVGYYQIIDYFDSAAEVQVKESADPQAIVEVTSRSPKGSIRLWLDRERGHLPNKLELTKQAGDLTSGGRRVDSIVMTSKESFWPVGQLRSVTWTADDIALRSTGDSFYLHAAKLVRRIVFDSGATVTVDTESEVVSIDFDPHFRDADFSPTLNIPREYPVTAEMADHLPFKWDGKGAVPDTSKVAAFPITRKQDVSNRVILLLVNAGLTLLFVSYLLFIRFRRRRSTP